MLTQKRSGRIEANKKDTVSGVSIQNKPKEIRLAIKSLFSKTQNMDVYLPAAISFWKSSGFLVLRSENIQLPENEPREAVPSQDFPASTFGPIW